MGQKKRIYPSENLEKINSGLLNTASKELCERIIKEYLGEIFSEQIIKYYTPYGKRNYLIIGLSFLKLEDLLKGCEEQYHI